MSNNKSMLAIERIQSRIFLIRGVKVMLSSDLAELYGVEVKVLNQAVKRNSDRFPKDFMFQLTSKEFSEEELEERYLMPSLNMDTDALNSLAKYASN